MKKQIIELLKAEKKALTVEEIAKNLDLSKADDYQELMKALNELEREAVLYFTKREKYLLFEDSHLRKGELQVTKSGNGFLVDRINGDVYISKKNLNEAVNGDIIVAEILKDQSEGKRLEGKVLNIIERDFGRLIGVIEKSDEDLIIKLLDQRLNINLLIAKDKNKGAVEGDTVLAETLKRRKDGTYLVKVKEVIATKNDPDKEMLAIMAKHNIEVKFSDAAIEQAELVPTEVLEKDIVGRVDLRDKCVFTIDGDDTKDIDDALSIEVDDEFYYLSTHIADVAHYIDENTPLDEDARSKGTSVYLVDRVVPMLPKLLSNGICSLNPRVERLAVTTWMKLDKEGNLVDYKIFDSVIKSRKQMTYNAVNEIIEEGTVPAGYEEYKDTILTLYELANLIRKKTMKRGLIEFDSSEVKIKVDDDGKPLAIEKRVQKSGERLIEDFMVLTNETVATHLENLGVPSIYRIHEQPNPEKIGAFNSYLGVLGYNLKTVVNRKVDNYTSLDIQRILKYLEDKPEYPVLSDLLLRSMKKAVYSPDNIGHFGLASVCYTHFTSPIRRYPDQIVHRLIKKTNNNETIPKDLYEKLVYWGELCSDKERAAIACERDVEDMKMAEYMQDHIGDQFNAMIVSVHSFGMFVELENLVEGLVSVTDMDGFFNFIEDRYALVNPKTGVKYTIGDKVKVECIGADKLSGKIDFKVVIEEDKK